MLGGFLNATSTKDWVRHHDRHGDGPRDTTVVEG